MEFINQIFLNPTLKKIRQTRQFFLEGKIRHHLIKLCNHKTLQTPKVTNPTKCKMKFNYHITCNIMKLQRPSLQFFHKAKYIRTISNDNDSLPYW